MIEETLTQWQQDFLKAYGLSFADDHVKEMLKQQVWCEHCKMSHHESSFCSCGKCYFQAELTQDEHFGTFVHCSCGVNALWD